MGFINVHKLCLNRNFYVNLCIYENCGGHLPAVQILREDTRLGLQPTERLIFLLATRWVDLETQKEGKKSTPKGREAEVTSTVHTYKPCVLYICCF